MKTYPLGDSTGEAMRLRRQSDQLRPQTLALLDRIGLKPGDSAIDLGCGPSGILDSLAEAVGPDGCVVGVDANPTHVDMAREYADTCGLSGVEVRLGDARRTGLAAGSFDLVHARTLLATLADPASALAEMVRLARPGGWVASQEPDVGCALCHPSIPEWDRMRAVFRAAFARLGADLLIGRRLVELYRGAGLEDVDVAVHPAGPARRTILPDLVRSLRPVVLEHRIADERELVGLDEAVRRHLADPATFVMPELMVVAWGRKPATGRPPVR
jgi:ubiquinone/menaquinone biosynthesis C-methylase UbiE